MLTLKQITNLYREGVDVKFRRKKSPFKGDYDPSSLEVNIYIGNISSQYDLDITILHEFIHAREDIQVKPIIPRNITEEELEKRVEAEAIKTYFFRPDILDFVKSIYEIK